MKFWPWSRKALTGTPQVVEALSNRQANLWPLLGGGARQRITEVFTTAQSAELPWFYEQSQAVRTVIDLISRNVGQLDLRLFEEISEAELEPRPDHPAALSLRYPNEVDTADHFIRSMVKDFLIFDNAYAPKWRNRDAQRIIMHRIPAAMVEVRGNQLFRASSYRIHLSDGTHLDMPDPSDMFHWRGESPRDPRLGISRLDTLRSVIAEDAALQQAIVELANAGMTEPVWAYRPLEAPGLDEVAEQGLEEDLTNRVFRSRRRVVVTQEGTELRSFGVNPRDAQMLEIRKWALQQVASLYGVPLGMVGLEEDTEGARNLFLTEVLTPICEELTGWLNKSILVDEYGLTDYCFEFNLDEKRMGPDMLKALVSATGRPVLTTDEGRAMINKKPIKGGDELVTPDNVTVGDNPKPSPQIMPIQDPNKPSQEGDHRNESKALVPRKPAAEYDDLKRLSKLEVTSEPKLIADYNRQQRHIDKSIATMTRLFNRQAQVLLSKAVGGLDRERWNSEVADEIEGVATRIVENEGGYYVARLGGDDFDMAYTENYLHAMAVKAAENLNDTTEEDINELGLVLALERLRGERAITAGTSIGARATLFARYVAAEQAPDFDSRVKTWMANTDRHADLNGVSVPIDGSWGGLQPGSAPNCRCSMTIS